MIFLLNLYIPKIRRMIMNKKIWAVVSREYFTRAKTKGYIIGTLMFPIIIVFLFGGIYIFGKAFQPSTQNFAVIDQTGRIYVQMVEMLPDTLKNGSLKFSFSEIKTIDENLEPTIEELKQKVLNKKLTGFLVIPENILESKEVKYSARNVSNFDDLEKIEWAISKSVSNIRLENLGYSPEVIRREMYAGYINLTSFQLTEKGEVSKSGVSNFLLTYLLTYLLMLFIMIYGQTITASVIEEKSQRITETIISSIKPVELMMGKLVGVCLLGITQLVVIGSFVYLLSAFGAPFLLKMGIETPKLLNIIGNLQFTPVVFMFFILYFFMGYLLYATLFAAVGSMVNTTDEGQQFLTPIIFLNIIGFFIMITVAQNPDTPAAFWASLFPFFTPSVMFARIAVSHPSLPSGAVLSIFTMGISIYLIIKLVAKIYRVGILMYGKKPSLKEALKWIRYK
ncbi:MAG: hypothetical protein DRI23_01200 [Candidatus Cloacimonadota bacterium]|nr:MAG: hypothetical protein DRI23_01200 [Candidatus Cloacimonadota bacterium]